MNCNESFELLYRYIDRDIDGLTVQQVEIHLKLCRPCWDRYEFERRLIARLKDSCHKETCSEKLKQRVKTLLDLY